MKIKVLTYNIHGARGMDQRRSYSRIGQFLKEQNIDIVLIQEMDTRSKDLKTEQALADLKTDHFPYHAQAPTILSPHGWFGNAIFSRYPITKENTIDISEPHREPRNILEVFVDTPYGLLHVVNTHKGLGRFERSAQLKKLHDLLSKKSEIPLIVGGDINQWHTYSVGLRTLNALLHRCPAGATFPTICPVFHLDRMWCRPADLFSRSSVLKTKKSYFYSDHYPVLAEIIFAPKETKRL